jgi:type III restriction system endonuclease
MRLFYYRTKGENKMSNKIIFQFDDDLEYQKKAVKSVMEMFIGHSKMIDSICADKIRKTRITEKNSVRNIDTV